MLFKKGQNDYLNYVSPRFKIIFERVDSSPETLVKILIDTKTGMEYLCEGGQIIYLGKNDPRL